MEMCIDLWERTTQFYPFVTEIDLLIRDLINLMGFSLALHRPVKVTRLGSAGLRVSSFFPSSPLAVIMLKHSTRRS